MSGGKITNYVITYLHYVIVFSGMVKVEVVEGTNLEPTPRMKRIPAFVPSRLNPYVMIDVTERSDGNRVVSRHIDKTVSVRGSFLI